MKNKKIQKAGEILIAILVITFFCIFVGNETGASIGEVILVMVGIGFLGICAFFIVKKIKSSSKKSSKSVIPDEENSDIIRQFSGQNISA